ncbi:MAG: phosphoribosylglycinamide formyltransferase [Pseudomonadota bacterium]
MTRVPFAVLISGRGSNMTALLEAAAGEGYPGLPVLVVSNRPDAQGLDSARSHGVPSLCIDHTHYGKDREAFERDVDAALVAAGAQFVALAGFMRVLTPWFVARWRGRLVNIHPSLLPAYKGLDTHARAISDGQKEAGCSVHYVTDGVDEGEVIAQARVPVLPGDTPDSLAARILPKEHQLYPEALGQALRKVMGH